jgi:hypothetical protein
VLPLLPEASEEEVRYFDKLSEKANSAKNFSEASQSDY